VAGADPGWFSSVEGVRQLDGSFFELAQDADPSALLSAATRAGEVRRFGRQEPTLSELFREATAA